MERLPAHPKRLPALTFLFGALVALLVLGSGGAGAGDAFRLLAGVLPIGDAGEGSLRVLLGRMCRTFLVVTLAMLSGMSFGLAVSVLMGGWWRPLRLVIGWSARTLGAVPPMAWALGVLFLLVQVWKLPVESLFPSRPGAAFDSWMMKSGRALWSIGAPAIALALPVFALTLRACLLRLDHLWTQLLVLSLRARGFSNDTICSHHLVPRLWPHVVRLAWPVAALVLAFAIPVEEVFNLDGWGGFMAAALRHRNTAAVAAGLYSAGLMLALWFALFSLLEKPLAASGRLTKLRLPKNRAPWVAGLILLLVLLTTPWWNLSPAWWQSSLAPLWSELSTALTLAALGWMLVVLGLLSPLAIVAWLIIALFLPVKGTLFMLLALALALPEWLQARRELSSVRHSGFMLASRMIGGNQHLQFWHHASRLLSPSLQAGFFRMAASALMWVSLLTFFGFGGGEGLPAPAWGALMQTKATVLLDDPSPALAPACWVALWCLCFQWFARGFGFGGPPIPSVHPVTMSRK
jgi:ABC-type dipeptide/oligopeptide/nickel transport system permease component